jgi:hypothetical protein
MKRLLKRIKIDMIRKLKSSRLKATSSTRMVRIAEIYSFKRQEAKMQLSLKSRFQLTFSSLHKISKQ